MADKFSIQKVTSCLNHFISKRVKIFLCSILSLQTRFSFHRQNSKNHPFSFFKIHCCFYIFICLLFYVSAENSNTDANLNNNKSNLINRGVLVSHQTGTQLFIEFLSEIFTIFFNVHHVHIMLDAQ